MTQMKNVMIDIETLGTRPGDTILSIGAVKFTAEEGITEEFYVTIDPETCKAAGLRAQKSTLEWWEKQSPEARAAAFKGEVSLNVALTKLTMWMPPLDSVLVWGNGANFDNTLVAAAYRAMKMDVPWHYWNDRCYRTIANMFLKTRVERVGTGHHALDDAKTQTLRLLKMQEEAKFVLK
jgi:hypothetical protein